MEPRQRFSLSLSYIYYKLTQGLINLSEEPRDIGGVVLTSHILNKKNQSTIHTYMGICTFFIYIICIQIK